MIDCRVVDGGCGGGVGLVSCRGIVQIYTVLILSSRQEVSRIFVPAIKVELCCYITSNN